MSDDRAALARRALGLVDLTDLSDNCTDEAIDALCRRAAGPHGSVAAVCVWPRFVARAAEALEGSGVRVATVVNFPAGGDDLGASHAEAVFTIAEGADEVDLVLPYRSFLAGRHDIAAAMVDEIRGAAAAPTTLKVILESGEYPDLGAVRDAAVLAIEHGADFVKTSTGKSSVSATISAVVMILDAIRSSGRAVGCKPSGGIRTLVDASHYLVVADEMMGDDWASPATFRFGASGLLDALERELEAASG